MTTYWATADAWMSSVVSGARRLYGTNRLCKQEYELAAAAELPEFFPRPDLGGGDRTGGAVITVRSGAFRKAVRIPENHKSGSGTKWKVASCQRGTSFYCSCGRLGARK